MSRSVSRREFLAGAAGAAALPVLGRSAWAAEQRPNILFILTDDHRFDAMSCAGHPFMRTPHMDRIAREGCRFTNAFVTTSLCSPSRASILTGRYAHSHGVRDNRTPLDDSLLTFPRLLHDAGYETALIGKWHMGDQQGPRPGFDHWVSFRAQGIYHDPILNVDGQTIRPGGYMTDLLTKYALKWLGQERTDPFCLYLSHKAAHAPFEPATRHLGLYSDAAVPPPPTFRESREGKPGWLQATGKGLSGDVTRYETTVRNYCRTLMAVDDSIGRVLSLLEEQGKLDNTVVVLAGDNGFFLGEHGGLGDKRLMYEESIRIPLLMRYPAMVQPGTLIDAMTLNIDLCPTFLQLAGVPAPEGVQGESLVPVLNGDARDWRREFLYNYDLETAYPNKPACQGVRTQRWKYTTYPERDDIDELFDLREDPYETRNLSADPRHASLLSDMRRRLERQKEQVGFKPLRRTVV